MDAPRTIAPARALAAAGSAPDAIRFYASPPALSADVLGRVKGRRVLFLLAAAGQVPQEILIPAEGFEKASIKVAFSSLDGGDICLDPLTIGVAWLEAPWNPTARLLRRFRREGRFSSLPSLRAMDTDGTLDRWLGGFDAVVVAGGHGRAYSAFIRDPLVIDTVAGFHAAGRVAGLLCHSPLVAALPGRRGPGFAAGKAVTCWPRWTETLFGLIPFLGRYMMPFGHPVRTLLEEAGVHVHDPPMPRRPVHAVVDGRLVTGRGPWSTRAFAHAVVLAVAGTPPAARR